MDADKTILVTGGAGYIGSHTVVELLARGHRVIVVDNLCNSARLALDRVAEICALARDAEAPHSAAALAGLGAAFWGGARLAFYEVDLCDAARLRRVFDLEPAVHAVIHFAGLKAVGESVAKPLEYYANNITGTLVLLAAMRAHGVRRLVFSSSACVYGAAEHVPVAEDAPLHATNPYGQTKLFIEQILRDVCVADRDAAVVLLRYFNPVGAHPSGLIGEDPNGIPNNLMPFVSKVAVGILPCVNVFGNDYPTPDGTGVRDYIHVVDLALGHIAALKFVPFHHTPSLFVCCCCHTCATLCALCADATQETRREGVLHVQPGGGPRVQRAGDDPRDGEGRRAHHPVQDHAAAPRRCRRAHVRPQQGAPRARLEGHARHRRHVRRHLALADHEPARLPRRRVLFQVRVPQTHTPSLLLFFFFLSTSSSSLCCCSHLPRERERETHELQASFFLFVLFQSSSFFRSKQTTLFFFPCE